MQDLQLIGVHEDGEHLLLGGADDVRFRMPVDEALRAAVRRDLPHLGQDPVKSNPGLRPREVQALIRAGASPEEAASRAGWPIEKVHRYEGPILAEREHVAGLAQKTRLRTRSGASASGTSNTGDAPTLSERVAERLRSRGVEATEASWDSWRAEASPWTIVLTFAAGGRQREASWRFDLADRTVSALDDEARWLSEEVQAVKGPIPGPAQGSRSTRASTVYDLEAEGGLRPTNDTARQDDPLDLMTAMRNRSTARGRRKPAGRRGSARTDSDVSSASNDAGDSVEEQALPLEHLVYDPEPTSAPPATSQASSDRSTGPEVEAAPALISTSNTRERAAESIGHDHPSSGSYAGHSSSPDSASPRRASPPSSRTDSALPIDSSPIAAEEAPPPEEITASREKPRTSTTRRTRETGARKTGRPSVPAWDEIMFGSRPGADRSS